jgi:hypothetical protein
MWKAEFNLNILELQSPGNAQAPAAAAIGFTLKDWQRENTGFERGAKCQNAAIRTTQATAALPGSLQFLCSMASCT